LRYLNLGLGVILAFVGLKMLLAEVVHVPTAISLGIVVAVLGVTIVASLRSERRRNANDHHVSVVVRPGWLTGSNNAG
jgi:tellurite resistance protein TerC